MIYVFGGTLNLDLSIYLSIYLNIDFSTYRYEVIMH